MLTAYALDWHYTNGPHTMEIRYVRGGKPPFHVSLNEKHLAAFDIADAAKDVVTSAFDWPKDFRPPNRDEWIKGRKMG